MKGARPGCSLESLVCFLFFDFQLQKTRLELTRPNKKTRAEVRNLPLWSLSTPRSVQHKKKGQLSLFTRGKTLGMWIFSLLSHLAQQPMFHGGCKSISPMINHPIIRSSLSDLVTQMERWKTRNRPAPPTSNPPQTLGQLLHICCHIL